MMHLFINALSASAGGGLTYVRNVLPCLAARDDVRTSLLVNETLQNELQESARVQIIRSPSSGNAAMRLWYEQRSLPSMIRQAGAHVLLSTGNFALFHSPVPQILLSRNALYTSAQFRRDLRERSDYRLWLDTVIKGILAKWSVRRADCTVAPSAAFAHELSRWTGRQVLSIHHGFSRENFFSETVGLPPQAQEKLSSAQDAIRILFVSHYNYYRNFETLIRSMALLKQRLPAQSFRLFLTCKLSSPENPGSYQAEAAAALVQHLHLQEEVVELGSVPYSALHHLYRSCHLYVSPAYAETFAHPLVEAMASGLPVIASDSPVHREICGNAAVYFPAFSSQELADRIVQLSESPERTAEMQELGLVRSADFSWDNHVESLLQVAQNLLNKPI